MLLHPILQEFIKTVAIFDLKTIKYYKKAILHIEKYKYVEIDRILFKTGVYTTI